MTFSFKEQIFTEQKPLHSPTVSTYGPHMGHTCMQHEQTIATLYWECTLNMYIKLQVPPPILLGSIYIYPLLSDHT